LAISSQITSISGCVSSHAASVAASRSAKTSIGRPVPGQRGPSPRRGRDAARSRRHRGLAPGRGRTVAVRAGVSGSMLRLAVKPSLAASRAPALPANAVAIASKARLDAGHRRAYRLVRPSTCSTNVTTLQSTAPQRNRQTSNRTSTSRPATVAPCNDRRYRECTRDVKAPQLGQSAPAPGVRAQTRTPGPTASIRSTTTPLKCGNNTSMTPSTTSSDTTVDELRCAQGRHGK
jgi:hypothetical protein